MTSATNSRVGGLFKNALKYFELPQSYREEVNQKMVDSFGKGVLTEANPTPSQREAFDSLVENYHVEYTLEQNAVEYFEEQ